MTKDINGLDKLEVKRYIKLVESLSKCVIYLEKYRVKKDVTWLYSARLSIHEIDSIHTERLREMTRTVNKYGIERIIEICEEHIYYLNTQYEWVDDYYIEKES